MIPARSVRRGADRAQRRAARGRPLAVVNTGDRPVQVGSHYHFAAGQPGLAFDRAAARGYRLDIPAGTAVRFEPGVAREVDTGAARRARIVPGLRPAAPDGWTGA